MCACAAFFSRKSCGLASRLKEGIVRVGDGIVGEGRQVFDFSTCWRWSAKAGFMSRELSMQVEGEAVPEQGQWVGMRGR